MGLSIIRVKTERGTSVRTIIPRPSKFHQVEVIGRHKFRWLKIKIVTFGKCLAHM